MPTEVIADTENIYIELDEGAETILLAYETSTTEQQIHDAWNTVNEFGYNWVREEFFDADWNRYVAVCVKEKPNE